MGTSYQAKDELDLAIKFYNKSLTEHRTPEILTKLRAVEKTKKDKDVAAYVDPAKADEAREKGNELFKKGDFVGAVREYTEAIKRLPLVPSLALLLWSCAAQLTSPFSPLALTGRTPRRTTTVPVRRLPSLPLFLPHMRLTAFPPTPSRLHEARRPARGPQGRQHRHHARPLLRQGVHPQVARPLWHARLHARDRGLRRGNRRRQGEEARARD